MRRSEAEAEFLGGFDAAAKQDAEEFKRLDARIAKLEAALSQIASATYGTEVHDTDAERADVYWRHLQRAQQISRGALKHG